MIYVYGATLVEIVRRKEFGELNCLITSQINAILM
jgi:hypothetical protein